MSPVASPKKKKKKKRGKGKHACIYMRIQNVKLQ